MDGKALDALLVRWHRWSADPSASDDLPMVDLDAQVQTFKPYLIAALIVEARNLACGAAVWRLPRAGGKKAHWDARSKLLRRLNDMGWFADKAIRYNQRGNRIGESNPGAKHPDHVVDLCVQMREQRHPHTGKPIYTLGQLALRFKVSKSTVQGWCEGTRRGQAIARESTGSL